MAPFLCVLLLNLSVGRPGAWECEGLEPSVKSFWRLARRYGTSNVLTGFIGERAEGFSGY